MSAFGRNQQRFLCHGVCLNAPQDLMPAGKYPILQNVRSYQEGTVTSRLGLTALANGALGAGVIHSLARLNDPTPFAAAAAWRVFGKGTAIFAGATTYPSIDSGYSGNPLSLVTAAPVQAPNPYVYVGDSSRQRKFDVNGHVYPIGIAPPLAEPTAVTGFLYTDFIADFGAPPAFVPAGTSAGLVTSIFRINTGIVQILYDSGTTGNCSVVPGVMAGIDTNAIITFGGIESLPVLEVCVAVASTTIGAIIYDAGTSGLCTIQPAGSLGTGQVEGPPIDDYLARYGAYAVPPGTEGTPPAPDVAGTLTNTIRQVDFPVNCLVVLNGTETVRILSVAVGPDGLQSFRCRTAGTFSAAQTITGTASFRACTVGTYAAAATLQAAAFSNVLTPPAGPPPQTVGGIKSDVGWTPINNLDQIVGRATLPDDDLHLSVRLSDCTVVDAIRVYLDVDPTTNDYTQNYFFYEWRSNDIIDAIQAVNTDPVGTLQSVRSTTVGSAIINAPPDVTGVDYGDPITSPTPVQPGLGVAVTSVSDPLAAGNFQWLDLACKIGQLIRIGTDPSRTLGDVAAAEILVMFHGGSALQTDFDSLWVSGGFGPDVGALYVPYAYCYRYRSSTTGARSNPSPSMRGGVIPRRQLVTLTGVQSPDAQCDLVDWFRIGGSLDKMTYVGTGPNSNPPSYTDTYNDSNIDASPLLEYNIFQPWATTDKARTGTCTVAGSALKRTGGTDTFNTSWAPGTPIVINGRTFTLQSQPPSSTLLFINENAGSGTGLTFTVPVPTLLNQPLPGLWGPNPIDGTLFACGDPNNPGALYWTYPNDADRTSDANVVIVTSGSEPLLNGCLWDNIPFVFSTDNLYQIQRDAAGTGWLGLLTPCGRGAWSRWAFTSASPRGIYFVTKDGIFVTAGGAPAQSVTDVDLSPIFPHDGVAGIAVNGFNPPDFTQTTRLHLSYVNGWLYFDYVDTTGAGRTLAMRESDGSWWPDLSTPAVATRLSEGGPQVYEELLGGSDGTIYTPGGFTDNGTAIACKARLVLDQGDARRQKLYRDYMTDADLTGSAMTITLSGSNGTLAFGSQVLTGVSGRAEYFTNILGGSGLGLASNLVIDHAWSPTVLNTPLLYVADVAYQTEPELATSWLSGPTTHGIRNWQTVSAILVCYLSTAAVTLSVVIDGVTYTYALPSTGGVYYKQFQWLQTVKGLTFQWSLSSTAPFLLFDEDTEIWSQEFGRGGYQRLKPFTVGRAA